MKITIPEISLVVLIGPSGSGKSSFARKFFDPTEVLSSDYCRALVSDDENDRSATGDAFEVLRFIAGKRLARQRLTVIDGDHVQPEARMPLLALAREHHCIPVAIVLDLPPAVCHERNRKRPGRDLDFPMLCQQAEQLGHAIAALESEGFRHVTVLSSTMQVDLVTVERMLL